MAKRGLGWKAAVAALAAVALVWSAWRSRWLWGLPEGEAGEDRLVAAVAGDPLGAALDDYLSRLAAFGYSGSVLVAKGGKVVLNKGYGLADRQHGRPFTADTIFDIASIAKQFTAAAILKLEMEGRLKVEDPLSRFFPDAPPDKAGITLHQLLTHTSGLRDTFGEEYEPITRQELLRRVWASQLLGPPGRRYRYSNGGYSVLAAVVETAAGESYDIYLHERLYGPAGMRHTGFHLAPRDLPLLARAYSDEGDWGTPLDHPWAADGPYWELRGNGGILTTTGDLYRWHLALAGDAVLSAAEREKYQKPYVSEGRWAHSSYAYGWSVGQSPTGKREISHIGGNGYFESDFRRYVDDGVVIIVSGNSVDLSALAIGDHLENRVFGARDADPPAVTPVPGAAPGTQVVAGAAALAARAAGSYALPSGERLRVELDAETGAPAGRLRIAAGGKEGLALLLGALTDDDRQMVADRDASVGDALAAARQGSYDGFAKVMGLETDAAAALLKSKLDPVAHRLGAWTGVQAIGGAARGGRWYSYARCDFAGGTSFAELGWAGPTAETLRFLDALPGQPFLPLSPGVFAAFDVRTGATVRAAFELPPAGGAAALTVNAGEKTASPRLPRVP